MRKHEINRLLELKWCIGRGDMGQTVRLLFAQDGSAPVSQDVNLGDAMETALDDSSQRELLYDKDACSGFSDCMTHTVRYLVGASAMSSEASENRYLLSWTLQAASSTGTGALQGTSYRGRLMAQYKIVNHVHVCRRGMVNDHTKYENR